MRLEGKKKERRKRPREDDEPKAFCYGRRCYGCGSRGDCRLRRRLASSSSSSPKKFDKKNERLIDRKKRAGKKISKKMLNLDSEEKRLLFDTKRRARFCAPLEKSRFDTTRSLDEKEDSTPRAHARQSFEPSPLPSILRYIYIYREIFVSKNSYKTQLG